MIVGYKIRRKSDGKYSTGGGTPGWSTVGKTWSSKNAFSNHLSVIREYGSYNEDRKRRAQPDYDKNWRVRQIYTGCSVVLLTVDSVVELETML